MVVFVQGTSLATKTDGAGGFLLQGVPTGEISLEFRKAQYLTKVQRLQLRGDQPAVAEVILASLDTALHNGLLVANGYTKQCGSCHQLHQTTLLTEISVNDTCFTCHNGANRGPARATYEATGHSPTQSVDSSTVPVWTGMDASKRGFCTTCHEPHGVDGAKVMLKAGTTSNTNAVCQACHKADGTNNTNRWPGWEIYTRTTNLHYNPPITGSGTLRTYPGKSYEAGECLNCHSPHGAVDGGTVTPAMTRDSEEKLCLRCHTAFRARIPEGTTVRHKCSLCHNPHLVESGNRWLIANGTDKTQEITDNKKDSYRGAMALADSYCTGCHYPGNPSGAPLYQSSNFQDSRYAAGNKLADLHKVHLVGPMAGDGLVHASCATCHGSDCGECHYAPHENYNTVYTPGLNRLRCTDCHDVHPTAGPTRPSGMSSKMLRTDRITSILLTNGKYNGKSGCGTGYPCHYNSATKSYTSWSCDWCHATTSAGAGSPGRGGCTCHVQQHQTIEMP